MNELILYLIKVIIIQGIFFSMYWLFFRKSTWHAVNRALLLLSIALSFVIPFLELPIIDGAGVSEAVPENVVINWFSSVPMETTYLVEPITQQDGFSYVWLLPWLYGGISFLLIVRSFVYLLTLRKLKGQSESIPQRGYTLYKISHSRPFSFLKDVFMPRSLFGSNAFRQVLEHECVHVSRYHSVDRLVLDFVVSLFWFNPFIYCYRSALIEIHEYEADAGVLKTYQDPVLYQEILFSQLQSAHGSGLVSHFNFQMIKKRIVMMNKQKKRTGWVYLLMLPVTLVTLFAFSSKEAMRPLNEVRDEISSFIGPMGNMAKPKYPKFQENDEPSVLPLKESEKFRMSSGFGMRMHPVEKVMKMHLGVDFACAIGTEVIATADGTVSEIRDDPNGYGKLIILDHGNGFETYYGQLSEFKVEEGDAVKRNQIIGLSGNSGMSTGPHLHYEVLKDGENVDPVNYIKNYTFTKKALGAAAGHSHKNEATTESSQKLREREYELARLEAELQARELELLRAEELLAKQEMDLAKEQELIIAKRLEKEQFEKLSIEERKAEEERKRIEREIFGEKDREERPLFIIDGEEVEEVNELSPDEIERIDVFKGEKAREKYGEKASNGVVVIKRKNSKSKDKLKHKNKEKDKKR